MASVARCWKSLADAPMGIEYWKLCRLFVPSVHDAPPIRAMVTKRRARREIRSAKGGEVSLRGRGSHRQCGRACA
jgi:hypothetical protein